MNAPIQPFPEHHPDVLASRFKRRPPGESTPVPVAAALETPAGWWSFPEPGKPHEGTIAGVLEAVEKATRIPPHWKTAIGAEIAALVKSDPKINFVALHAHYHLEKGNAIVHITVTPSQKLL